MIERIVFYIGTLSAKAFLSELCADKALALRQQGIYYPDNLRAVIQSGKYDQGLLGILGTEAEAHVLPHHLRTVDDEARGLSPSPHILHLSGQMFYNSTDRLTRLQAACRSVFPQAKQCALLCFARQDLVLECWMCLLFQLYPQPTVACWLSQYRVVAPDYERCLRFLCDAFGHDAVYCAVPEPGVHVNQTYAGTLCEALGLTAAQIEELGVHSFSPKHDILLPREALAFASITNFERKPPATPGLLDRWSFQAHKFTPESGYIGSPHSLMGPKLRSEVLESFAGSNAVAAEMLGLPRLFSNSEPEPDWEPWTGLNADVAFKIAERLDTEFAQGLLEPFEKLPTRYQTRDQRIVHQALRDVLDTPSVTPLIHPRLEEPKLSVLTSTYNHAAYIAECIESVLAQQTNFPIQYIIADDGSDDGTQDIILDYAAKYPHIVPVFQKTRSYGSGNVRNLFDMARTEYVAICEGDDYYTDPAKLQTQVDFLEANPDCALCFHLTRVKYEGDPKRERIHPQLDIPPHEARPFYYFRLEDLLRKNIIQTNSVMYRWRFRNGLPDWFRTNLLPGDWYWHILHAEQGEIGFINKIMSVYRRHEKSLYYLVETDLMKLRAQTGLRELEVLDVLNKHFNRKYESTLLDLANSVFSDCVLYDNQRAEKEGSEPVLPKLCENYPEMAQHFLQSLKKASNVPK